MRPLKRETTTARIEAVQPGKVPHQMSGSKLAVGLDAANDQSPSGLKGLLTRRRKRRARRSVH